MQSAKVLIGKMINTVFRLKTKKKKKKNMKSPNFLILKIIKNFFRIKTKKKKKKNKKEHCCYSTLETKISSIKAGGV